MLDYVFDAAATEDFASLTHAERIDLIMEIQLERARLDAAEQRLLAAIVAEPTDDPDLRDITKSKRYVREELAVALRISPETAGARMDLAERLVHTLPSTLAAVGAGALPLFFARAIATETVCLPSETVTAVETKVLPRAIDAEVGQSYGEFKRALRRAVLTADPRGAEEKFVAAHEQRRVCRTPEGNGMSWLSAYLPDHAAQAVENRLHDAARRSRRHRADGDDRTMDQRIADALGHWALTGELATFDAAITAQAVTADSIGATTAASMCDQTDYGGSARSSNSDAATESSNSHAATESAAATKRCSCGGRRTASTTGGVETRVVVALSTLAGFDEQPAELDGVGPIPAALARMIAFSEQGSTWRRLVTDPLGKLIDYGTTVYQPPAPLERFVKARDQHCRAPGCFRRAVTCDLDHVHPFSHGGQTSARNLQPLCARHHKLKHEAGWELEVGEDGTTVWTTPTGIRAELGPATYPLDTTVAGIVDVTDLADAADQGDPDGAAAKEASRVRLDRLATLGWLRPWREAA